MVNAYMQQTEVGGGMARWARKRIEELQEKGVPLGPEYPYFVEVYDMFAGPYEAAAGLEEALAPEAMPTGVESIGGYDFLVDEGGNIISSLGRTPEVEPEELTRWQEAQLWQAQQEMGLRRRELGWEREEARLPYEQMTAWQQAQTRQQELQYAAHLAGLGEAGFIERWYAQQAQQARFQPRGREYGQVPWVSWTEPEREKYMETRTTPRGYQVRPEAEWLMRSPEWQVTTDPEALQAGFIDPAEYQRAQAEAAAITAPTEVKITPTGEVSIKTPMTGKGAYEAAPSRPQMPMAGRAAYADVRGPYAEAPRERGRRRAPRPRPEAPPTPAYLPKFAPWLTPGQPITPGQIPTPSGQLWAGTLPSERAGLGAFAQWGGGRTLQDIEAHMAMMRPETPRGVAGRQWRPARQWT